MKLSPGIKGYIECWSGFPWRGISHPSAYFSLVQATTTDCWQDLHPFSKKRGLVLRVIVQDRSVRKKHRLSFSWRSASTSIIDSWTLSHPLHCKVVFGPLNKSFMSTGVEVNTDITFECPTLSRIRCDITLISFPVHKCWIAVASRIVFVYGLVCFYVRSCHMKAAASGWGECSGVLRDILVTAVCEHLAPSHLPSWLLCHFTPCLGWILWRHQGLYLTHGCSDSTPCHHAALLSLPLTLQISSCKCASVSVSMHTSFFFSFFFPPPS